MKIRVKRLKKYRKICRFFVKTSCHFEKGVLNYKVVEGKVRSVQFETLTLSHKMRIERARALAGHTASSHAFTSLFLWKEEKGYTVCFEKDAFLVKEGDSYFFPCGEREAVISLLRAALDENPRAVFRYAREEDVTLCQALFGEGFRAEYDAASREYLYDRAEQIAMPGKRFQYQRAKCNKARRLGEMRSVALTAENRADADFIIDEWEKKRSDSADAAMARRALSLIGELSLIGNILYLDGQPIGFDLGAMIAPDTLDNHIAKTLRDDVDALMKLLWYEALPECVTVINREEDLGIRGLAIHKQDAQPIAFNDTYTLIFEA